MFDSTAFSSWTAIFAGAGVLGLLFGIAAALSDFLFSGELVPGRFTIGASLCAFVGYLGVALLIRRSDRHSGIDPS